MAESTCKRCGTEFAPTNGHQRYCTKQCQKAGERERYRAKLVPMDCDHCGETFMGHRWHDAGPEHKRRYCTPECQAEAKRWRYRKVFSCKMPWRECGECGCRFLGRANAPLCGICKPQGRRWLAGYCLECGEPFVGRWHSLWPSRYCSDRCIKRAARTRRRACKQDAWVEEVWRPVVYERDDWTCRICNEPVDRDAEVPSPFAPTLDHIVPLAIGGDHSYANIQCAHFICNSRKGASCDGQLRLAA